MALSLLWLAHRDQKVYARLATALLLSGTVGLAVFAAAQGRPVGEVPLAREYLTMPGVRAGWYVLMALAVIATTTKVRPRVAVTLIALSSAAAAVPTADRPWLSALSAAAVPLLAWYAAGRLLTREEKSRTAADASRAAEPPGHVVPFRPRTLPPEPRGVQDLVPLGRTG
ncbi:hypothetical protein ACWDDN_37915 [Streptomyces griseoruber]